MGTWVSVILILVVFSLLIYLIWDTKMEMRSGEEAREERLRVVIKSLLKAYVKQEYCDRRVTQTDGKVDEMLDEMKRFISLCKACSNTNMNSDT